LWLGDLSRAIHLIRNGVERPRHYAY
jgi:hypothetical protein